MEVKEASLADIDDIVKVHLSAFQGFFLSDLGEYFLRTYYRSVLASDKGVLLVCCDNNQSIGFCAACTLSAGFHSSLIKNNILPFTLVGCQLIFSNPKAIIRLVKNLTKKGDVEDDGLYGELLSIGSRSDYQGKGVGKKLLEYLEVSLANRNVKQLSLTTDLEDNDAALQFYSKLGFNELYQFIAYPNRKMHRLIKNL